eukprot:CAMPEP_0204524684 /NCGR_PEP_ID=MMETSP0661-20131031/7504_1 /ASSEMBLY_ACC=CAM_ASM_000606 /TAXON_ID=109239 /ORGANISM="Alexandrium margalefi, Strain AMGDE01CS-322" /LENGTH=335 /DNA_ID=CAMNT_0051530443 /DNA_START=1 /DNA_END=1008 /DNA_ORIENTATION=-
MADPNIPCSAIAFTEANFDVAMLEDCKEFLRMFWDRSGGAKQLEDKAFMKCFMAKDSEMNSALSLALGVDVTNLGRKLPSGLQGDDLRELGLTTKYMAATNVPRGLAAQALTQEEMEAFDDLLTESWRVKMNVETLDLSGKDISDDEAMSIAKALTKNDCLKELELTNNNIGEKGACALAEALTKNDCLKKLWLNGNDIGEKGACALAEALTKNDHLGTLVLMDNNIGEKGACALAEALTKNDHLEKLSLAGNNIGDKGACALAEALTKNDHLEGLYLSGNNIGENGACALAEALTKNDHLARLNLKNNHIGDNGARALAEAKEQRKTPIYIDVI